MLRASHVMHVCFVMQYTLYCHNYELAKFQDLTLTVSLKSILDAGVILRKIPWTVKGLRYFRGARTY